MQIAIKLLFYGVVIMGLLWIYVRIVESTSLFIPSQQVKSIPEDMGIPYEDITFRTKDDVFLNGWLIKADDAAGTTSTLIYFHGNAGNIGDRFDKIALFHQLGVNLFIIDYRGYGNSKGSPSEEGVYLDAQAAYDYLMTRNDINKAKIISYGVSLGGAVAVDLAQKRKVAGLICESTFSSAADMGKKIMPFIPSFLLNIKFDSLSKIKDIDCPKLFIHSKQDTTVPYKLGRKLFEAAGEPKSFLEIGGDHNDGYFESRRDFSSGVAEFLKEHNFL